MKAAWLGFVSILVACDASFDVSLDELSTSQLEAEIGRSEGMLPGAIRNTATRNFTLNYPSAYGRTIFAASRLWMSQQPMHYALPKNCANNVSLVLRSAERAEGYVGAADRSPYEAESVFRMVEAVRRAPGSIVADLPLLRSNGAFIRAVNTELGGAIPTGALVAGCTSSYPNCNGDGGLQHIAIVGHTDAQGVVWLYHNNWLRPENLGGTRPARLAPYMVSEANLRSGHPRQWMPTPWLKLTRNGQGMVTSVTSMLPEIDDLDPAQFNLKIAIVPQLVAQVYQ